MKYILEDDSESSFIFKNCNHKPILMVDDEPFNIITVEGIFDKNNIEIDKAFDG